MKFLRDLAALDKAQPLVRANHEDLFPSLFVECNRASLNNLPQLDELLDIDNTKAVEDGHTSALTRRRHYELSVRGRLYLGVVPATQSAYHSRRYAKLRCSVIARYRARSTQPYLQIAPQDVVWVIIKQCNIHLRWSAAAS
jgi:hypothetical protein